MIEKIIIQPDNGPWLNAHLTPGMDVRVGIPTPSEKLAFHAFQNEYKTMVSAQAFWNARAEKFRVPSASDLFETDFALDSAGYTAMMLWGKKGPQKGHGKCIPLVVHAVSRAGVGVAAGLVLCRRSLLRAASRGK